MCPYRQEKAYRLSGEVCQERSALAAALPLRGARDWLLRHPGAWKCGAGELEPGIRAECRIFIQGRKTKGGGMGARRG